MKVLYIFDSFNSGGAGRQFSLLVKYLSDKGFEVKVVVLEGRKYYYELLKSGYDIDLMKREYKYDLKPWYNLSKLILEYKPNIVHSWGWMSAYASVMACSYANIPLIGALRTATLPSRLRDKVLLYFKTKYLKYIISNTSIALQRYKICKEKGFVVYNGFDLSRIPSNGKVYSDFTVVMAARMSEEKDWICFINAIKIITQKMKIENINFIGLGDGVDYQKIFSKAEELINEGVLQLPGFVSEPMDWLINADVGVLVSPPGVQEGTSNSILEYMACSLPVICTGSGGNYETITEGKDGLFVEVQNSTDLAEKIVFLYSNPTVAQEMGHLGNEKVINNYSIEAMGSNTLEIYEQIVRGNC